MFYVSGVPHNSLFAKIAAVPVADPKIDVGLGGAILGGLGGPHTEGGGWSSPRKLCIKIHLKLMF